MRVECMFENGADPKHINEGGVTMAMVRQCQSERHVSAVASTSPSGASFLQAMSTRSLQ